MRLGLVTILFKIISLVNGIDIQCICETDCNIAKVCRVARLNVTSPNTVIRSVNGKSEQLGVKYLRLFMLNVQYVPKGIEKFFPNIEVLEIASSYLRSIEQSDLKPFHNLKEIDLRNNDLVMLNEGLFDFNRELRRISFDGNKDLKFVEENILKHLKKLEMASFHKCHCIDMQANNRKNIYSQRTLESELKKKCHSPKEIKHIFCREEIQALKDKISYLEDQLADQVEALEHALALLHSHSGNLDLATKNLLETSKQLKSCAESNMHFLIDEVTVDNIDLTCGGDDSGGETCNAVGLKVETKNSNLKEVKCLMEKSVETEKIWKLLLVRQQVLFLPKNIGDMFPYLEEMFVNSSGLFEIDSSMFQNMTSLKNLTLTRNKLFEIPSDAFNALSNLERLDLSLNNIESLEFGVFKQLVMLIVLNLSGNKLTTMNFNVFENLRRLKYLMLNGNKLEFISTNILLPLNQLETVDFTNNICINMSYPEEKMELLEAAIIDNCVAPIELKCIFDDRENRLQATKGYTCKANELVIEYSKTKILRLNGEIVNPNILVLSIVDQSMKFMPYQLSQVLPSLQELYIERSKLTSIEKHDFSDLIKLKLIVIHYNKLTEIREGAFDNAPQLEYLDLSFNNIRSLSSKVFECLVNLRTLVLSNNQIQKVKADFLPQKNSIQEFKVDNNQLDQIEAKILRFLKKANTIDFSGNLCINLKYERNDPSSKTLAELSGEISINCSHHD